MAITQWAQGAKFIFEKKRAKEFLEFLQSLVKQAETLVKTTPEANTIDIVPCTVCRSKGQIVDSVGSPIVCPTCAGSGRMKVAVQETCPITFPSADLSNPRITPDLPTESNPRITDELNTVPDVECYSDLETEVIQSPMPVLMMPTPTGHPIPKQRLDPDQGLPFNVEDAYASGVNDETKTS